MCPWLYVTVLIANVSHARWVFFLSPHVRPWHCRKRPCRGAERTTWRGKRSPPTSRGRWATSRPKSRSTAPATPSCARRTAPWQRSWRGSYRSTTSERRYWSWHARTHRFKTKVKKWIYKPKPTRKPAWHNLSRTSHIWASAPVSNLWIMITFHPRLPFISCTISVLCSQKSSPSKKWNSLSVWGRLINPPDCLPEPGEGLQTQRPERKAAGDQTRAGQRAAAGGRAEAQAGERARTFRVSDLSSQHICNSNPLALIFMGHFNIPQMLKQATEYKLKVKVMKEQEIDMRTQVV